jgi:hypothetical protein
MQYPVTVADATKAARAALAAGDIPEATRLTEHAKALKAIEGLGDTQPRLDLSTPAPAPAPDAAQDIAVKTWFQNRYGTIDAGLSQVAQELYGDDYRRVAYAKNADFLRYIKTGSYDPRLHRLMLYSPDQLALAVLSGVSVGELKSTQVESQDVLGGLTARFN